jgi:Ras-related C3 botulinum toxin substrate 1
MKHLKIVAVGDGAIGKTCLLVSYSANAFPSDYIPTVFDNYSVNVIYGSQAINLQLWDTAGQEDYKKLRPLSYPGADVFIVGFSIEDKTTLENVQEVWIPEIKNYCPGIPFILVGTKSDLRDENRENLVSMKEGKEVASKVGAREYVEVSAMKGVNLREVFDTAIKAAFEPLEKMYNTAQTEHGCCEIL